MKLLNELFAHLGQGLPKALPVMGDQTIELPPAILLTFEPRYALIIAAGAGNTGETSHVQTGSFEAINPDVAINSPINNSLLQKGLWRVAGNAFYLSNFSTFVAGFGDVATVTLRDTATLQDTEIVRFHPLANFAQRVQLDFLILCINPIQLRLILGAPPAAGNYHTVGCSVICSRLS